MPQPTLGRIVLFRSRTGDYDVPAIITATKASLNPKGVKAGAVPKLDSDQHLHLTVFTPGTPAVGVNAPGRTTEKAAKEKLPEGASSLNLSGCYQEWNVPPQVPPIVGDPEARGTQELSPGAWRWPWEGA